MTTSVLLGWWMLRFYGVGGGAVYIHILGGRHKRARPRLPSHPHHIPITFPISHFPTTYVATARFKRIIRVTIVTTPQSSLADIAKRIPNNDFFRKDHRRKCLRHSG